MQIAESATLNAGQWCDFDEDVDEIDDVAEAETVDEIADRAAEDQVQAGLQHAVGDRGAEGVGDHDEEDADRAEVQQQRHESRVGVRADAERRAGVAHVHELQEVRGSAESTRAGRCAR